MPSAEVRRGRGLDSLAVWFVLFCGKKNPQNTTTKKSASLSRHLHGHKSRARQRAACHVFMYPATGAPDWTPLSRRLHGHKSRAGQRASRHVFMYPATVALAARILRNFTACHVTCSATKAAPGKGPPVTSYCIRQPPRQSVRRCDLLREQDGGRTRDRGSGPW